MKYLWYGAFVFYIAAVILDWFFPTLLTDDQHTKYNLLALVAYALGRVHSLEDRLNALAKGKASQGAREQGRDSASATISLSSGKGSNPSGNAEFAHFHRNADGPPIRRDDCFYAQQGKGYSCIFRNFEFSWGDNIVKSRVPERTYRYPERYHA